ncbi:MAG TPA: ATP-binding protein [Chitinophagaceae bacterium]|nr:ATP-binding protein [Chitinophagaceae bacterium]
MKWPSLLLLLVLLNAGSGLAQNETINRLRNKLSLDLTDTAKCNTLDSLSMHNMFFNHQQDSTLYYCNEYINLAYPLPDKKYLALAYARISFYYINTGQYKEALNMALKGLNLSEQYNIRDYLSALYYDLTWAYFNLDDDKEALNNGFKGISFLKVSKDPFFDQALHLYALTGDTYLDIRKPDSALFYYKKMDSTAAVSKELAADIITYWSWTQYYLFYKKDYKRADSVIAAAIPECLKYGEFLINYFYAFSADSYLKQGRINEAIAQAKETYRLSLPITDPAAELRAASVLNICYEKSGNRDSAYHYLKLKDSLNDIIQQHLNATEVQQSQFNEQLNSKEQETIRVKNQSKILTYVFLTALAFFLLIAAIQWRNSKQRQKANILLQHQKDKVESTLSELKSAQAQLIQSEKMASLGELTAGIAHEIQNPLNFVNNFAEVNIELANEMNNENDMDEIKAMASDIKQNSEKILLHGKRADAIVKNMLQHSRQTKSTKEPADINALCDEYLRLSYHGMRAKDKSFNAGMKTDFDESIGKINIVPQDMGRVLLNLINNAFYAVSEKKKLSANSYQPLVEVKTHKINDKVEITVKDNGNGIPDSIKEKIFQPFFTTKPTGSGTGLGLSLSYDIIKAHGGEITVESKEGEGTSFIIALPG